MPLRLLWLTETYYPARGGMAQSCDRIVHALRQAGVTVDLVHFSRRARRERIERRQGGRYIAFPVEDGPGHTLNRLWNLISADGHRMQWTHVVAFGGRLPLLAGPVYAAWLKRPLVTLLRGNDLDLGLFDPGRRNMLGDALTRSEAVCVVTRDHAEKIAALFPGVDPVWIPNGIALDDWCPLPSERRRARAWRDAVVAPGRRVIGLIGQLKNKKGGRFFIECLLTSGTARRFHLLFVGDVAYETLELLERYALDVHYSLHPFMDRHELLALYPACDVVAIPSFYDGMPNVLLEAAALARPLLAARVAGMRDVLEDGRHGFLFPPGDRGACREALHRAATVDDAELGRLGREARALVERDLTARQEAERYLALFSRTRYGPSTSAAKNVTNNGTSIQPREHEPLC